MAEPSPFLRLLDVAHVLGSSCGAPFGPRELSEPLFDAMAEASGRALRVVADEVLTAEEAEAVMAVFEDGVGERRCALCLLDPSTRH